MVVLTTEVIVTLVVVAVVLALILLILFICCVCRKCDQCARWSRRKADTREEERRAAEVAEGRRVFNEIREQHDTMRDQLRVKYNLNGGNSSAVVIP